MTKPNTLFGKGCFALTIGAVLFRHEIGMEMNAGGCTFLMTFGLFLMFVGYILDDLKKVRAIKAEEKRRRDWIRSLHGK